MSQEVDELFGKGGGGAAPRVALALTLVVLGLALAVLGLGCTAIPGGILVLLGWFVVEQDKDRLASGYLPVDSGTTVLALRIVSTGAVVVVAGLMLLQCALLMSTPVYELVWGSILELIGAVRSSGAPPVLPNPVP